MENSKNIYNIADEICREDLHKKLYAIYSYLPLKARQKFLNEKSKKKIGTEESPSFQLFQKQFNMLLQYNMLDICLNQEKIEKPETISYYEMLFITDIGDILKNKDSKKNEKDTPRLDHLLYSGKQKKSINLTYVLLQDYTPEDVLEFKSRLYEYINPIHDNFMKMFAIAEININKGDNIIFSIFSKFFKNLYGCLLNVDNRLKNEGESRALNMAADFFFKDIPAEKKKVKAFLK